MKKFLIGCLGVFLILAVGGSALTYFFVIKPGMQVFTEFAELGQQFEQANQSIENTANFVPPANFELDPSRFDRFLAAQRDIRTSLGNRLQELDEKYRAFDQSQGGSEQAGIADVIGAYGDFFGLLLDAKNAQIDALNAQNFSLEEYSWTRNQVYRAIGQPVGLIAIGENFSLDQMMNLEAEAEAEGEQAIPQSNIDLVEPHREELMEMLALAWWGL